MELCGVSSLPDVRVVFTVVCDNDNFIQLHISMHYTQKQLNLWSTKRKVEDKGQNNEQRQGMETKDSSHYAVYNQSMSTIQCYRKHPVTLLCN